MSIWTHVCGCIRVDYLGDDANAALADLNKILGRIVDPDSDDCSNMDTTIPYGSEGSLKYHIIDESSPKQGVKNVAAFTIPIWGDLRDYSDAQAVRDWFYNVCDEIEVGPNEHIWIRQAGITINVEGQKTINLFYGED